MKLEKILSRMSKFLAPIVIAGGLYFACDGGGGDSSSGNGSTTVICEDKDHDGYYASGGCGTEIDCNDYDASIHPNALETPYNGKDDDCDSSTKDDDLDGDGYCILKEPYDCDDLNKLVYPGNVETPYNGLDDDCDSSTKDDDLDGDGYYILKEPYDCGREGDKDDKIYPGALEVWDEKDNDCDEEIDEGVTPKGKIVFECLPYICTQNIDGSNRKIILYENGKFPKFSPDGDKIVFSLSRDGNLEIFIMNVDGSSLQRVTYNSQDDIAPSWSVNNELVYSRGGKIYINDLSTGIETYVTDGDYASFSFDGKKLAINCGGKLVLYDLMSQHEDTYEFSDLSVVETPVISPNNKLVAFSGMIGFHVPDIYIFNLETGELKNLTNTSHYTDKQPYWAPEGDKLAFSTNYTLHSYTSNVDWNEAKFVYDIYIMNIYGEMLTRITFGTQPSTGFDISEWWPCWTE